MYGEQAWHVRVAELQMVPLPYHFFLSRPNNFTHKEYQINRNDTKITIQRFGNALISNHEYSNDVVG